MNQILENMDNSPINDAAMTLLKLSEQGDQVVLRFTLLQAVPTGHLLRGTAPSEAA